MSTARYQLKTGNKTIVTNFSKNAIIKWYNYFYQNNYQNLSIYDNCLNEVLDINEVIEQN